jgi:hypothetical protein
MLDEFWKRVPNWLFGGAFFLVGAVLVAQLSFCRPIVCDGIWLPSKDEQCPTQSELISNDTIAKIAATLASEHATDLVDDELISNISELAKNQLSEGVTSAGVLDLASNIIGAMPGGAVVAFDRPQGCPTGWTQFEEGSGRMIVGVDGKKYRLPYEAGEPVYMMGGAEMHTLTEAEMPGHTHRISTDIGVDVHNGLGGSKEDFGITKAFTDQPYKTRWTTVLDDTLEITGGNEAHNNMPPYIALYFCKKD